MATTRPAGLKASYFGQQPFHPLPIGVPGDHLGQSRRRNPFANILMRQIIPDLVEHLFGIAIGSQVNAVLE